MIQKLDAPISVLLSYNHKTRHVQPVRLQWEAKDYTIEKIGFHHTYREGRTLIHVFSVETASLFFRIAFDTSALSWRVQEIADGESN